MALEQACVQVMPKPWGSTDLLPWSEVDHDGVAIGELWFQRRDPNAPEPALLLKLLFTQEALSIQVHPDDAVAQAMGLPHGKTEAWYILSATPDATIGVGLKSVLTAAAVAGRHRRRLDRRTRPMAQRPQGRRHLRARRNDPRHRPGPGARGDPAAERYDVPPVRPWTCQRELHIERGVAAAHAGPAEAQPPPAAPERRQDLARREPVFRPRTARSGRGIDLGAECQARNLAGRHRWRRPARAVAGRHRRGLLHRGRDHAHRGGP